MAAEFGTAAGLYMVHGLFLFIGEPVSGTVLLAIHTKHISYF
jgi:hypothetical protein